jgi:hypothetical protein
VLFLHVLGHIGRDPGLGPGDQQAPLARQVREQVGDQVSQDVRVAQDTLTVTGHGGTQRLMGLTLRIQLLLAHMYSFPDLLCARAVGTAS